MAGTQGWKVALVKEVQVWFRELIAHDRQTADLVEVALDCLRRAGPTLGRPLVDRIQGSRHHNMKELRPASSGRSEVRILFAFDPTRRAVLLVAGDKSGDWRGWYDKAIPVADARYEEHLNEIGWRD
jgi:hypothetical protein